MPLLSAPRLLGVKTFPPTPKGQKEAAELIYQQTLETLRHGGTIKAFQDPTEPEALAMLRALGDYMEECEKKGIRPKGKIEVVIA